MPKVTWNGEGAGDAKEITQLGYTFKANEAVEVSEAAAKAVEGNQYFKIEGENSEERSGLGSKLSMDKMPPATKRF